LTEGAFQRARELIEIALEASPEAAIGWVHLAAVHALRDKHEDALSALGRARGPGFDPEAHLSRLARDLKDRQKPGEAQKVLALARHLPEAGALDRLPPSRQ
jgi:hypothetical protein